jgi:hypothetical protein
VLCGIGTLPGTLHDRSIVVSLVRARPGEVQQRLDSRRTAAEQETCRKLARWVKDNYSAIEAREPALPTGAYNRVADNWRPLFAIAEVVGGAWPARASAAYTKLTSHDDTNTQGIRITLLADIRDILTSGLLTRISSADLCKRLVELEEQPWPEYGKGKPISQNQLSRLLRPFDIQPRNIKVDGKSPKGYHAEDFADAFSRYLPVPGDSNRYPATEAVNTGENGTLHPLPGLNGSGLEKPKSPNVYAGGSGVAVQNPVEHVEEAV